MTTVAWLIACVVCFWGGFMAVALCDIAKRTDENNDQRYHDDMADQEIEAVYHV